jgi:hypothetical protein
MTIEVKTALSCEETLESKAERDRIMFALCEAECAGWAEYTMCSEFDGDMWLKFIIERKGDGWQFGWVAHDHPGDSIYSSPGSVYRGKLARLLLGYLKLTCDEPGPSGCRTFRNAVATAVLALNHMDEAAEETNKNKINLEKWNIPEYLKRGFTKWTGKPSRNTLPKGPMSALRRRGMI